MLRVNNIDHIKDRDMGYIRINDWKNSEKLLYIIGLKWFHNILSKIWGIFSTKLKFFVIIPRGNIVESWNFYWILLLNNHANF